MKVICLWSGGKDSTFACYKARSMGYDILSLFNFIKPDRKDSLSHGIPSQLILKQVEPVNIPILQKAMPKKGYREEFKNLVMDWKEKENIEGIVFGDIYLQEHKDWIEKVCEELKVEAVMPLWGMETKEIIMEFIGCGFEAIVVTTKADLLGKEWLARKIDTKFISELDPEIDPCGESGEFHTFVYNGPIFKRPVEFSIGKKILKDGYWFLEVSDVDKKGK